MRVYKLDLESLLPLLAEFQQDGSLFTVLPPGIFKQKDPCKVRIDLLQGAVVYCHVEDDVGQIYVLDSHMMGSMLYGLGEFDWCLDEEVDKLYSSRVDLYKTQPLPRQASTSRQHLPILSSSMQYSSAFQLARRQPVSSLVPKAVTVPDTGVLNALSRNQRRILVLADGMRCIKKITEILFPSSQDMRTVLQILRELENMGLITLTD